MNRTIRINILNKVLSSFPGLIPTKPTTSASLQPEAELQITERRNI